MGGAQEGRLIMFSFSEEAVLLTCISSYVVYGRKPENAV